MQTTKIFVFDNKPNTKPQRDSLKIYLWGYIYLNQTFEKFRTPGIGEQKELQKI
jgi:hypothetical protein